MTLGSFGLAQEISSLVGPFLSPCGSLQQWVQQLLVGLPAVLPRHLEVIARVNESLGLVVGWFSRYQGRHVIGLFDKPNLQVAHLAARLFVVLLVSQHPPTFARPHLKRFPPDCVQARLWRAPLPPPKRCRTPAGRLASFSRRFREPRVRLFWFLAVGMPLGGFKGILQGNLYFLEGLLSRLV